MTLDSQILAYIRKLYFEQNRSMKFIEKETNVSYSRIQLEIKMAKKGR